MSTIELKEIDRDEATNWMSREQYELYFNPQTMSFLQVGNGWFYESDDGRRFAIEPAIPWGEDKQIYLLKELFKNGRINRVENNNEHNTKEEAIEALLELLEE
jgi:hypothetical protein